MAKSKEVDRISSLPDNILTHILSFMCTDEAVATSILSKRWEYIWTTVPVLQFNLPPLESNQSNVAFKFKTHVDRVLTLNAAPFIQVFHIDLRQKFDDFHIWSWIRNMMRRNVFEIEVICYESEVKKIRPTMTWSLVSENLKVLKLEGLKLWHVLFSLPNLSVLHLLSCRIYGNVSVDSILAGLPCLNELLIGYCGWFQDLCICSSSLKRLSMINHIAHAASEQTTTIEAPSLEYLYIKDKYLDCNFELRVPLLFEVEFDLLSINSRSTYCMSLVELLKQVPSLKTLNLNIQEPLHSMFADQLQPDKCPFFNASIWYDKHQHPHINLLFLLCEHAPSLVSLKYSIDFCTMAEFTKMPPLPNMVHKCLSSTLKVIDICKFQGTIADNAVAKYFLTKATLLKVVTIHLASHLTSDQAADAISQLLKIPMASPACELLIRRPSRPRSE